MTHTGLSNSDDNKNGVRHALTTRRPPATVENKKFAAFVKDDYAPKGRTEPGLWALPSGDALYRFDVEQQTTTQKSPEEIHELGLAEVSHDARNNRMRAI
jgi:uncharacterized protein (DUF885 family)